MPLPDQHDSLEEWAAQQTEAVATYAEKIDACITNAEWQTLNMVLASRQAYLTKLFSTPFPESFNLRLKQLAESVLQQDSIFKSKVEAQKHIVAQLQMQIEQGRRAIKAYSQ